MKKFTIFIIFFLTSCQYLGMTDFNCSSLSGWCRIRGFSYTTLWDFEDEVIEKDSMSFDEYIVHQAEKDDTGKSQQILSKKITIFEKCNMDSKIEVEFNEIESQEIKYQKEFDCLYRNGLCLINSARYSCEKFRKIGNNHITNMR